jgi:hypothetical protein
MADGDKIVAAVIATRFIPTTPTLPGIAKAAGIKAIGIADLPLPEESRQGHLQLEGHADGQIIRTSKEDDEIAPQTSKIP